MIAAIEKSIKNMGGTIFLFFVLRQFVAYFTYTNMGTVMALSLSGVLQSANIGSLPLLLGFIIVVAIIDLLLTGSIAKWAIFAPVFVLTAAGPDNATMVPSYLTYYHFFTTQRVGYGAAIAVVQMILTVTLAIIFLRFQARQQATE